MAAISSTANTRSYLSERLGMSFGPKQQFQVHNNEVYERHLVFRFQMTDCEDPEIYAAQPIHEWQQTEHGKWVMQNGINHQFHIQLDPMSYSHTVIITAHITPKRWTEHCLRFDMTKL